MRRVVITGLSAISPIGNEIESITKNLKEGYCAIENITSFDTTNFPVKVVAKTDIDLEEFIDKKSLRRMDRVTSLGVVAAIKAIRDSNLDLKKEDQLKVGVMVSSGIGGLNTICEEHTNLIYSGNKKVSPFFIPKSIANITAAQIAINLGIHGYVGCPVTACAGSLNAILDAYRSIKDGYSDVILAGGSESSINELALAGFNNMKALTQSEDKNYASIPFDINRNGFVMGEGASILVLEEYEHAKRRNAKIYAEILSASISCDAFHITAPVENGSFAKLAIIDAIKSAGISVEDIDYINAHATSTMLNDKIEAMIYSEIFKRDEYFISGTKSMTGHLLGASGALESVITILAMKNNFIPPTINTKSTDCSIKLSNVAVNKEINIAMNNSLGFGGHNISVIFRRI